MKPLLLRLLLILLFFLSGQAAFSQPYTSINNSTGGWETPTTWNPVWPSPQTSVNGHNIDINGYITSGTSLSFSGSSKLTVKDTLVIKGNLTMNDNNDLKIEDNGILIIWGDLTISYDTKIESDGYLVVTGNIIKVGDINQGELKSNDNPVKVFVGGTIPSGLTDDNDKYKALNCTSPSTTIYHNSNCSYGNLTDIVTDPIYPFFQSTCSITTPTITAGSATTFCAGGSVTLTSSAGSAYLWSNGATTQSIDVSISGSYTVRVTSAGGCISAPSVATIVTVNALPLAPIITAGGPTTFCTGGSVILTSSAGNIYLWSNGATTQGINVTASGIYTVRVTNANGCQSAVSAATNVTVNGLPPVPTITSGGPTTFCAGGSVTLTSGAGTSYLWSNGATTQSINAIISGSYTVKVTNSDGCQSTPSIATVVTVNALPVTPIITAGGPTTFCAGGSVTLTSGTGNSYLWSTGATTATINVTSTGSYTVRVTSVDGCQSAASAATIVTVNALPPTPTITTSGPTSLCSGGSVTLTSSAGTSYLWSTSATTPDINVTSAGNYSVQVTDGSGCQSSISAPTVINVNALPVVNAGTDVTIPNGTSTTIDATVTGTGPFTYSWSPSGQLVNASIEDPTTVNLTTTTVFTLTATSLATSCSETSEVTITISGGPLSSTPTASSGTICSGDEVQLYANASGGTGSYTYTWTSTPIGFTSFLADPIINPSVTTTYNLDVFDGFSTVNRQVTVAVIDLPATPTITAGGPTTFCSGGSVTLTSSPGTKYLWSTGTTSPSIDVTVTGSYTVIVTNSSGCQSAVSASEAVTVNALPAAPTITAGGPTTFCDGGNVTLTSSPGMDYLWSTGATTASIIVNTAGSYSVQVADVNGCQSAPSAATIVTVNALPATPGIAAGGPTNFCAGGSVTLTSNPESTYLWSNGATTPTIDVTVSGSYSVRLTNSNGCQSAPSVATVVTVNNLPPAPTITAGGPTTFCFGSSVTLTSDIGTGYLWSTGAATSSINVTATGSYTVRVTDANGCQSAPSSATVITVNSLPFTPTISAVGPTTFCAGGSVTLISSAGAGYLWSNAENTQSTIVTTGGNFSVEVTDPNGCKSAPSIPIIVTVNSLPVTPTITASGPTTFCEGSSVTLTSNNGSEYFWSEGSVLQSINITSSGTFTVQTSNEEGCRSASSQPMIVTVNAMPQVNISSSNGSLCLSDQRTLTGNPSGGTFTILNGPGILNGNILSPTGSGTINLEYFYTNGCSNKATQSIIVDENVVADAGPDQELIYLFETQMEADPVQFGTGEWSLSLWFG